MTRAERLPVKQSWTLLVHASVPPRISSRELRSISRRLGLLKNAMAKVRSEYNNNRMYSSYIATLALLHIQAGDF